MRAVFFGLCSYAALCCCLTTEARAQPAPDAARTVTLKSGAIFRGELIELIPLDHITIKLATGDIKRFEWADLNEAPPSPPAQAITPPPPMALPPPPRRDLLSPRARYGPLMELHLRRVITSQEPDSWSAAPKNDTIFPVITHSAVTDNRGVRR